MDKDIKKSISATDKDAQYDEKAKNLLGHKIILAHILVKTIDEFKGMNPKDVVQYIEGEPYISTVPVDAGSTNVEKEQNGEKVTGLNTENSELNEGLVRFDIIFYVRMKDGLSQVIVNIEAQKAEPSAYDIINRAVFYISRMISSQKGREFIKSNYNDIKRVYSIWVCMSMSQNCMNYIHFTQESVVGTYQWKGDIDLANIVLIGLAEDLPEKEEKYELHRLLGALLSAKLDVNTKLDIIGNEFDIPLESDIRKDVNDMCNLSQGIKEQAYAEGTENGIVKGVAIGKREGIAETIIKMYRKGYEPAQISDLLDMELDEIQEIIENE
nr:hypothetical protein [uncultured Anaerobutyricum sp.]